MARGKQSNNNYWVKSTKSEEQIIYLATKKNKINLLHMNNGTKNNPFRRQDFFFSLKNILHFHVCHFRKRLLIKQTYSW